MVSKLINLISNAIGDASFLGLECESGDFSDCNLNESDERVPFGCENILMFSRSNTTCGSLCGSNRSKRSADKRDGMKINKEGWTPIYMSGDEPTGTGDHEHYRYYLNNNDNLIVHDPFGEGHAWQNCTKTAISIRERATHTPWWKLSSEFTLLFSKDQKYSKYYADTMMTNTTTKHPDYQTTLKPYYG